MKYEDVITTENKCYQNEQAIFYHRKKKKISKTAVITLLVFALLIGLACVNTTFTNEVLTTFNAITQVGKPTADLFDENSNVFFVSFFNSVNLGSHVPEKFILPFTPQTVDSNGVIANFTSVGSIVSCGARGIVKNVCLENNIKVVYIEHAGNLVSRYENLEYVGVAVGQLINEKATIGSVRNSDILKLSFKLKGEDAHFNLKDNVITFEG